MGEVNKYKSEEYIIVGILQHLQEEHYKQCKPYIDRLVRIRAARIEPMFFDSRFFDTDKVVIWSNPDLVYKDSEL